MPLKTNQRDQNGLLISLFFKKIVFFLLKTMDFDLPQYYLEATKCYGIYSSTCQDNLNELKKYFEQT